MKTATVSVAVLSVVLFLCAESDAFAPSTFFGVSSGSICGPLTRTCPLSRWRPVGSQLRGSRYNKPNVRTAVCKKGDFPNKFGVGVVLAGLMVVLASPAAKPPGAAFFNVELPKAMSELVATNPRKQVDAFVDADSQLEPSEKNTIRLYRDNKPSVVYVSTFQESQNRFNMNIEEMPQGSGSGFVWDDKGHIVTNYHVIRAASSAQIGLLDSNGKTTTYSAKLTGANPDKDIAVLQIDAPKDVLRPIAVGQSANLQVGQMAVAIGNPFGLDHTLTIGVVSGLGRQTTSPTGRPITNVIQTDAAINPGNSGGALLDSRGRLIGMNTAILSPSGSSAGIGFAIPSDTVKLVVDSIIKNGQVARPALGISFLEAEQSKQLGIPEGVLILEAPRGSPAQQAGLRGTARTMRGLEIGDIIVGLDGKKIKSESDLFKALEGKRPGQTVSVTALRNDDQGFESIQLSVKLGAASDPAVRFR